MLKIEAIQSISYLATEYIGNEQEAAFCKNTCFKAGKTAMIA